MFSSIVAPIKDDPITLSFKRMLNNTVAYMYIDVLLKCLVNTTCNNISLRTKAVTGQYFNAYCIFRKPSYCAHIYNVFIKSFNINIELKICYDFTR